MNIELELAQEAYNTKYRELSHAFTIFSEIRSNYRSKDNNGSRLIGDDEFLAARVKYNRLHDEMDEIEAKLLSLLD